jgi:hypothetical protein
MPVLGGTIPKTNLRNILMNNYTIVLARYNEDISWCNGFKNVFVYNKGPSLATEHEVRDIDNLGHEAQTYLTYIIEHYNSLPEVVCFFQAIPHIENFTKTNLKESERGIIEYFVNLKSYSSENYEIKPFGFCLSPDYRIYYYPVGQPLDLHETNGYIWFRTYINKYVDINNLKIYFGANFSVRKEAILSRPISFYVKQLTKFKNNHCELAHFFERAWYYVFNLNVFNHDD